MSDPTRTSQSTRHATGPAGAAARTPAAAVAPTIRRPLAATFRLLIAAAAVTGTVLAAIDSPAPVRLAASLAVQTASALALVSVVSAHRAWTGRRPISPRITGALLSYAALAALLHHAVPTPAPFALPDATSTTTAVTTTPQALSHLLLFTLIPLAALADWLLLTTPRGFRLRYAWQWPAYPLLYLSVALALSLPATAGSSSPTLATTVTPAVASVLLPLITIAIDQVRPSPLLRRNRISPTGISPLK